MTMISRLLGFVRDMLIARIFGVDMATDAFFVAFKIPNFLRRLFGEGAFAHAFVPVLSDYKENGSKQALQLFIDRMAGSFSLILFGISVLGVIAAPLLITLLAPGFPWQGEQHDLSVQLLQITFPYLLFIALVAFAGSILNAHAKFAVPALTPVILNISMIIAAIWLAPMMSQPVTALAWGVFTAGVVQLLFQIPSLWAIGLVPKFKLGFADAGVKKVLKLMLPAMFSVSVTQINLLLDTLVASFLPIGSVSWLYYSDRLVEFPLGILGIALGTVILPSLSLNHAADDKAAFSSSLDWGLRLVFLIGMPATIGLIMLAEPMLSTLFQYKEFSANDVHFASLSLRGYAIGLLGYILVKVLVPGFTSRQDLKTPVRYGIYAMIVSLALNVLAVPFAHAGLALATSLGALYNSWLLFRKLLKENVYQPQRGWWLFSLRILLASAAMIAVLYYWVDANWWNAWSSSQRILHLIKWVVIGCVVYFATLMITGLKPRHLIEPHGRIERF
jgi:putative peptidoglycan lipid II flippase